MLDDDNGSERKPKTKGAKRSFDFFDYALAVILAAALGMVVFSWFVE